MTDGINVSVDASQTGSLIADLHAAPERAISEVRAVMKRGAQNIKSAYRTQARASRHFKGMATSFSYEETSSGRTISYEIGPDKGRKGGPLGNIFFFGTSRGGGSGDLLGPLDNEAGPLAEQLSRAMRDAL